MRSCRHSSNSSDEHRRSPTDPFAHCEKSHFILDDRYEFLFGLGDPSTTKVYVCRDLTTDETLVVKYDTGSLEKEYDVLSALSHDRIIGCH